MTVIREACRKHAGSTQRRRQASAYFALCRTRRSLPNTATSAPSTGPSSWSRHGGLGRGAARASSAVLPEQWPCRRRPNFLLPKPHNHFPKYQSEYRDHLQHQCTQRRYRCLEDLVQHCHHQRQYRCLQGHRDFMVSRRPRRPLTWRRRRHAPRIRGGRWCRRMRVRGQRPSRCCWARAIQRQRLLRAMSNRAHAALACRLKLLCQSRPTQQRRPPAT